MRKSDAFWDIFRATGYIGAYLIYRDYKRRELQEELKGEENLILEG